MVFLIAFDRCDLYLILAWSSITIDTKRSYKSQKIISNNPSASIITTELFEPPAASELPIVGVFIMICHDERGLSTIQVALTLHPTGSRAESMDGWMMEARRFFCNSGNNSKWRWRWNVSRVALNSVCCAAAVECKRRGFE